MERMNSVKLTPSTLVTDSYKIKCLFNLWKDTLFYRNELSLKSKHVFTCLFFKKNPFFQLVLNFAKIRSSRLCSMFYKNLQNMFLSLQEIMCIELKKLALCILSNELS